MAFSDGDVILLSPASIRRRNPCTPYKMFVRTYVPGTSYSFLVIEPLTCCRSKSLSVLDWYIPGFSELPLRNRLLLLLAGPFSGSLFSRSFLLFFFFRFVCACTPSTASREGPAPSRVSVGAGG